MDLDALLPHAESPPSNPRLVALLASELGRDACDLRKASQLFGADPALALRLLRRANAEHSDDPRGVISIAQALALLAPQALRTVAAEAAAASGPTAAPGLPLPQFWRYSVQVARLARALAASVGLNRAAAYAAGLLHAVGELVLHAALQPQMAVLNQQCGCCHPRRARVQRRLLGTSYAEAGAALALRWGLPTPLVDALRWQLAPFENEVYEPLAGLVHLAAWRARAQEAGLHERALATSFPGEVGLALGMDIDMVLQQDPIDWGGGAQEDSP